MPAQREILNKAKSVEKTRKITRAMEMVAASKMRKTQERMFRSRPYSEKIHEVITHLAKANPEYHHPYLNVREVRNVGMLIITSDRGLCGGLNTNVLKLAMKTMKSWGEKNQQVSLAIIGHKGELFFSRFGGNVIAQKSHIGDEPAIQDILGVVKVMLDQYDEEKLDAIYLVYNDFVNAMTQTPTLYQLLPLQMSTEEELDYRWDYLYEPDAKQLLNQLLRRYIEAEVFQAVLENIASEQASRMVAMKSASDNAKKIIDDLKLAYNKARQAAITKELAEIVAGAEALG